MDRFRFESIAFKSIPWRSDILYIPKGLMKLEDIPELGVGAPICLRHDAEAMLQAYLNLINVREYRLWAHGRSMETFEIIGLLPPDEPPAKGLQLLQRFCETGVRSMGQDGEAVLLAKELLYYRLLDVFAQIYFVGVEDVRIQRSNFPFINLLVGTLMNFMTLEINAILSSLRATPASKIGLSLSTLSHKLYRNLMDQLTRLSSGLA